MSNKTFFILTTLIVILGALGVWYYQRNIYSKEILKLEIFAPEKAEILQEVEYIVKYKNNGNIRLESPKLIFEYPKYSITDNDEFRKESVLDDIYPGEEKTFSFKARLLGKEGEAKIAKAYLNYTPKNLKARYESTTTCATII